MLVTFTDFGPGGPYAGQMQAVLAQHAPGVPQVELMRDAPACDPRASAYLLAAYAQAFPAGSVFLAVIDPGVGTERRALLLKAGGRSYIGPDNGLLALAARRDPEARAAEILWRPDRLSASFHGRDLFAPMAARVAMGEALRLRPLAIAELAGADWPDDLPEIVYLDPYGNAVTGLRAARASGQARLLVAGHSLPHAETFGRVAEGSAFWYENANGLVEIAVNRGSALSKLGLAQGLAIAFESDP